MSPSTSLLLVYIPTFCYPFQILFGKSNILFMSRDHQLFASERNKNYDIALNLVKSYYSLPRSHNNSKIFIPILYS